MLGMTRVSVNCGTHHAILQALDIVADYPNSPIAYINSTSASGLLRAVELTLQPWVKSQERMESFQYHRVNNLRELENLLRKNKYEVVILERLDIILLELLTDTYEEQNRCLHLILSCGVTILFLDDWEFVDKYFYREVYRDQIKKRRTDRAVERND